MSNPTETNVKYRYLLSRCLSKAMRISLVAKLENNLFLITLKDKRLEYNSCRPLILAKLCFIIVTGKYFRTLKGLN